MSSVGALTIYAIRRDVGGQQVSDFDTVIVPEKRLHPAIATREFASADNEWEAKLFMWPGEAREPGWLGYVEEGFGPGLDLPDTAQSSAVIVVRVFFRRDRYYAVAFGGGRYAIRRDAVDPKYGLQVALNAIYEGDEGSTVLSAATRIQQVNTRRVAANTMRTLRQTNRSADFDAFELDPDGDQLDGVTGNPVADGFGRRIRGTDSVRLGRRSTFDELGEICRNLARYHERDDYQRRFKFVDNITAETNAGQISDLNDATVADFLANPNRWALAPPGLLDFDEIDVFEIPALEMSSTEISPVELSAMLTTEGVSTPADLAGLRINGIDAAGDIVDQWDLLSCLDGQVDLDGTTFLAEGGQYYRVAAGYIAELDTYIGNIRRSSVVLPDSVRVLVNGDLKEITEGDYNEIAADSSDQFLLLDKKLVSISTKTSPVEVCDVLTLSGELIHVKRKFSSSSLSHLFAQGYVSSELLSDNAEYRAAIRNRIPDSHAQFRGLFPDAGLVTANFEIVYAIVGEWGTKELTDIPFFSKVNLRRYSRSLRRLQYQVTYADVDVVNP